ncbi:MAG: fluoride efflux transporter CrcB [Euryarchaeota archaeon]|nr:fluoride efflux transporter CrcB [Euryarchaeota archaeon]|tara:strand:+ start:777 stop:1148 length:372 start_codon:yes stop_codon:yes gene_type:complete
MSWLMVALGGALGSVGRYGVGLALERFVTFPLGTLVANVLGSIIIGICAGFFDLDQKRPVALFIMVGFCGGFTTFSAFSLNTLTLLEQHAWLKAGGNILLSMVLCLFGTWLGFMLGQTLKKVI